MPEQPLPTSVLRDLPLWRVQWVALPGHVQCLNVHVPHYCDMFERLVASAGGLGADRADRVVFGPDGPLYGHLLLPGGSANLGLDSSKLTEGSAAPTVGALMRLREVKRSADGRLFIRAEAIGRFRVLRASQELPYTRADVTVFPDAEEVLEKALQKKGSSKLPSKR